ncbi:peptidylprolyl isomerase SurA [Aliidiomarina shirensis]|uniref:Chaperone SurA n=1 Tax=Aliidiomarina shirensis TaxID=1048642 RepID=A0A432WR84_9GAMM|nr:peptidylprolyl isomerase SurA [Aliidiomarina shirensis]RUO36187.1 peptidylprolyl isomerase SurA [Aliidiomarina shirensis]
MRKITALAFGVVAMLASTMAHAETLMDRVAIVVNEEVILESELNDLIENVRSEMDTSGANAPSETAIRTQATERLITQKLQMQMADRMGIRIDDAYLDQALASIASENNLSVEGLRLEITATGASWAEYREEIRKQIAMSEVQRSSLQRRIYMSPQEIDMLMKLISEQGADSAEYRVSHILISLQNEEGEPDEPAARARAEQVLELARRGDDFAQLAVTASSAQNALEGGDMGWMSINAMPTLFANALENQEKGHVAGLLRSGLGFHILKIQDVRGAQQAVNEEVRSRHILIRPSVILSDNRAQQMLNEFREQIQSGEKTFAELATENSADTASAAQGGDLGWSTADVYVPEFRDRVARMEPNVISEPFKTTHGWHIVEVLERREQDVTEQRMREQAQQILYSRKYQEEMEVWLQELRDNAFVDIRI